MYSMTNTTMGYELDRLGFSRGDLLVFKGIIDHWAVYAGGDIIIHYNQRLYDDKASIIEESIQKYWSRSLMSGSSSSGSIFNSSGSISGSSCSSGVCTVKRHPQKEPSLGLVESRMYDPFPRDDIVRRAREKVGEDDYDLLFNNCETFAKWCKYGVKMSEQAQKVGVAASTVGSTSAGAVAGGLAGAAIGSVVPVVGTTVGGLVGAGIGAVTGGTAGGVGGWGINQIIRKWKSD